MWLVTSLAYIDNARTTRERNFNFGRAFIEFIVVRVRASASEWELNCAPSRRNAREARIAAHKTRPLARVSKSFPYGSYRSGVTILSGGTFIYHNKMYRGTVTGPIYI